MFFDFLSRLQANNNREWFEANKKQYEQAKSEAAQIFERIYAELIQLDAFEKLKMYSIYRDVRFSHDKTPYKNHFSAIFMRRQPHNRGSFYVHLEPNNSFIGAGFWGPEKEDLLRIRQAIEIEDDLKNILKQKELTTSFGAMMGEAVKSAPKGFDKEHPRIHLIRHKQFIFKKSFADNWALQPDFAQQVAADYRILQPFFQYMTDVLTTDANGEPLF